MTLPLELFLSALVTLLVITDPLAVSLIFAGLTGKATPPQRRSMAIRAVLVAGFTLLAFALGGQIFLGLLGISLDAFRIAGGIMLFLIAADMVFETRAKRREERASNIEAEDVSVFPIAMPMLAGPGSITAIMLLAQRTEGGPDALAAYSALALVMLVNLVALLTAAPIMHRVGPRIESVIARLMGVILAALATQFVIDGVKAVF